MNGEPEMISPVSGWRSGAPGGAVSRPMTTTKASSAQPGAAQAVRLGRRQLVRLLERHLAAVGAEVRLDHLLGQDRADDAHEDRRGDHEVEVADQRHLARGIDEPDRVVGHLGEQRVGRRHEEVDEEDRGDAREAGREAGQRMPAEAVEGGAAERHQHQVAGVGGDRRDDAEHHDDEGEDRLRRDLDDLAHQRGDQAGFLGDADADHRHDDDADRAEVHEVRHDRGRRGRRCPRATAGCARSSSG